MIHIRFITLFVIINCTLGGHTFTIANRTNHLERSASAALNADGGHVPSAIRPYSPRAGTSRNVARVADENMLMHPRDNSPTPTPDGPSQDSTTVHIADASNFAILLPRQGSGASIGDSEDDALSYCFGGSGCSGQSMLARGFIAAAAVTTGGEGSDKWIQVTGCINPSAMGLSASDQGGQYDVRFPNGAKCTFGGYGKSFIEQVEPASRRFCLRCCSAENDQTNCNSHNDEAGCVSAIPGTYDFPDKGVSCG